MDLQAKLTKRFSNHEAQATIETLSLARMRGYSREHEIEADGGVNAY